MPQKKKKTNMFFGPAFYRLSQKTSDNNKTKGIKQNKKKEICFKQLKKQVINRILHNPLDQAGLSNLLSKSLLDKNNTLKRLPFEICLIIYKHTYIQSI